MNRIYLSVLTSALLISTNSAISLTLNNPTFASIIANVPSNNDIRTLAQSITVKILVGNTAATGFIIAKDGNAYTVVTNAHVVSQGGTYQIKTPDGKIYPAILNYKDDSGNDLALLQFSSTQSYSVAVLGNSANLSENEEVYSAGYAYDSESLIFNSGTISLIGLSVIKEIVPLLKIKLSLS